MGPLVAHFHRRRQRNNMAAILGYNRRAERVDAIPALDPQPTKLPESTYCDAITIARWHG